MMNLLNQFAEGWFSWQISMLWQVAILIAIVAAADFILRKWAWPQVRYALWLLILVKLVLPPSLTSPASFTAEIPFVVQQTLTNTDDNTDIHRRIPNLNSELPKFEIQNIQEIASPVVRNDSIVPTTIEPRHSDDGANPVVSWKVYALCVWAFGAVLLTLWLVLRLHSLRREHLKSESKLPTDLENLLQTTAQRVSLKNVPQIILTNKICCPAVFGVFNPVLLMPAEKLKDMTAQDAEHIFLHELSHIKRGDLLVHAIYMILQIAYWFNPLLWIIRKHIQNLRELCCDAAVASVLKEKTAAYRQTLLETARRLVAEPVDPGLGLLGLFENSGRLIDRLRWLEKKSWKYRPLRIATVFIVICIMSACVLPMTKNKATENKNGKNTLATENTEVTEVKKIKQMDFVIKGRVTDAQTGKPIADAKVGDVDEYAGGKFFAVTDTNGDYSYKTYYEEHNVKCTAASYKSENETLLTKFFGSEKEKVINFQLATEKNRNSKYQNWVDKICALKNHKQAAFVVIPQLLDESPDFALKTVQEAWPKLTNYKVKQGILKAFHFAKHPYVLTVLNLGVHDSNGQVVAYALTYVSEYSGVKFPGFGDEYLQWYEQNKNKTPDQIFSENKTIRNANLDQTLDKMLDSFKKGSDRTDLWNYAGTLGDAKYVFAIPAMIGIIDADNSYDTIYGVGYFGLTKITGVDYSPFHDGTWWHRWWQKNKTNYPQQVQGTSIPELPKTSNGRSYTPYPDDIDMVDGLIRWILPRYLQLMNGYPDWNSVGQEFTKWQAHKAIPYLIAAIDADSKGTLVYNIGYYGLVGLTGVPYDKSHDAAWWKDWWQKNKSRYPEEIQSLDIEQIKKDFLNSSQSEAAEKNDDSRSLLMERKEILEKTLRTVEMKHQTGQADSIELLNAKIDLLRAESELAQTPQKRIEIAEQIADLYKEQEKITETLVAAGRATQDELNKIKLQRLDAEKELAEAKTNRDVGFNGKLPLHLAVMGNHQDTAEMLISKGADVNAKDSDGNTPLHLAASNGSPPMCEFLIGKGANLNAKNMKGRTPLDLASANGHRQTAELLISKGAEVSLDSQKIESLINDYKKVISNGPTIELVGICQYPSKGKQWWRSDGTPLGYEIETKDNSKYTSKDLGYEFVFKPLAAGYYGIVEVQDSTMRSTIEVVKPDECMFAVRSHIKKNVNKTNIKVKFASDNAQWQTVAEHNGKGATVKFYKGKKIIFSQANDSGDGVIITVTDNLSDDNANKLIAKTKDGKDVRVDLQTCLGVDGMRQQTFVIKDTKKADIKSYQFQITPFESVTFKNIFLRLKK
ncbi:MAG: ankyrin repeat domain-containing protein [Planctomycetaceae bacterium]|nr:ankyrin repeat domain-containing protein [Planctomycetaceae bacterium]